MGHPKRKLNVPFKELLNCEPSLPFLVSLDTSGVGATTFDASLGKITPVNTLYVDGTNGDDVNDGSAGSPLATIRQAIVNLNATDQAGEIQVVDTASQFWGSISPQVDMNIIATSETVVLAQSSQRAALLSFEVNLYLENLKFDGDAGEFPMQVNLVNGADGRMVCLNCEFTNGHQNGFDWNGDGELYLKNCKATNNVLDGFNYHDRTQSTGSNNGFLFVLEDSCEASGNGTGGAVSANATTAHEFVNILRVNGMYKDCAQVIADVDSVKAIAVGCDARDAVDVSGTQNSYTASSLELQLVLGGQFTHEVTVGDLEAVYRSFAFMAIENAQSGGQISDAQVGLHYNYLWVEDGTGVAGANCYINIQDYKDIAEVYGYTVPVNNSDTQKYIFVAMQVIEGYADRWSGDRYDEDQHLNWPRSYAYLDKTVEIGETEIPEVLQRAVALLVHHQAIGTPMYPDPFTPKRAEGAIKKKFAGPMGKEFFRSDEPSKFSNTVIAEVEQLICRLMTSGSNRSSFTVSRS